MTILKTLAAACVAATVTAGVASATTVVDFTGTDVTGGVGTSVVTFDNGTVSGTATSSIEGICFGAGCTSIINQDSSEGLGITRTQGIGNDDPAIDSIISESMTFVFDETVIFESISFGFVDSEDDWTIAINGTVVADESSVNPFVFAPNSVGDTLTVTALFTGAPQDGIFLGPDDFNVKSITVAAIPLPAAGWMLVLGLGGMAAMRRRSSKKA